MKYENWSQPTIRSMETIWASIRKLDQQLSGDSYRWTLEPAGRNKPGADFKEPKYVVYKNAIETSQDIEPPELVLKSPTRLDIMDGRHRIYALYDAGYDEILVQCSAENRLIVEKLVGSRS